MHISFLFLVITSLISCASARQLIADILGTYKKILSSMPAFDEQRMTIEHVKTLATMHDDDSICSETCEQFLKMHYGTKEFSFSFFESVVTKLYGDMISDDPYEPQEIKLALGESIDTMKVMYITWLPLDNPFVEYTLTDADDEWKHVSATSFTYSVPQKWWPVFTGMIYEADMTGLAPAMRYTYRVGGYDSANRTIRYSTEFTFSSAPTPAASQPTTVGVLADQGTFMLLGFMVTDKLAELQDKLGIDFTMIVGDIAYAGLSSAIPPLNISKEDEFERVWDLYGIQSQRMSASRPFMVGNGNHERFYDWTAYKNRYHMPYKHSGGSQDGFWYSYEYGNVHWISISSEHSLDEGSEQRTFLINDLKAANAQRIKIPWVVVSIHKPVYSSVDGAPSFREQLEPLMLENDVDLVIVGHMHCYERIHPVNNFEVTSYPVNSKKFQRDGHVDVYESSGKGPVYVVQGNTGAMQAEKWIQPQPAWSAVRFANGFVPRNKTHSEYLEGLVLPSNYTDTFGFGVAEFVNATHLFYRNIPVTGNIGEDSFWVIKNHGIQEGIVSLPKKSNQNEVVPQFCSYSDKDSCINHECYWCDTSEMYFCVNEEKASYWISQGYKCYYPN